MEQAHFAEENIPWDNTISGEQYYRGVLQTTQTKLVASWNENGQLPTDPLLLWDNGDKMVIMGGNHRASVWKHL